MNSLVICESCGELAENRLALSCGHFICGPPDDENLKSSDRQRLETLERKRCPKHKDCQKNIKILRKIYVQVHYPNDTALQHQSASQPLQAAASLDQYATLADKLKSQEKSAQLRNQRKTKSASQNTAQRKGHFPFDSALQYRRTSQPLQAVPSVHQYKFADFKLQSQGPTVQLWNQPKTKSALQTMSQRKGYNNQAIPVINSATSSTRYASQPQSNFQALHIAVSMDHSDSSDDESYSQLQSPHRWTQQKNTRLPQKSLQKIGMFDYLDHFQSADQLTSYATSPTSYSTSFPQLLGRKVLQSVQSLSESFQKVKLKVLRLPPTLEEKVAHLRLRSTLKPNQQKAVDALQRVAQEKGGAFILVDNFLYDAMSVDDFISAFVLDWDDSQFYREKGLLHVLRLRTSDFDSRGDFEFPLANGDRQVRGGLVYHQPNSNWIRVGLRVRGRYDGGSDDWIMMDGNANEWAVGFHGSSEEGTRSISQTRQFKVTGKRQVYSTRTDNNYLSDRKGESCGGGAYFGAKIEESEPYATYKTEGHKIVIQVRIKPDKVRIPAGTEDIRIVNEPRFIRPYGLCLKMKNN